MFSSALNSKVRGAELHFWIALTFALHMLSGFAETGAKQIRLKPGPWVHDSQTVYFLFPFFPRYSPTEDDVYVIDFSPTPTLHHLSAAVH